VPSRFVVLAVITGCLVCGVAGWWSALPRPDSSVPRPIPIDGYVDASGAVVPTAHPTPTGGVVAAAPPKQVVDAAWLATTSSRTGIPTRVLDAYAMAALATTTSLPGCHLAWNTVAAIGDVESANGTLGGAHIDDKTGEVVGTILGPVLDGTRFDAVRDTDGGLLDGNTTWDRAVGPLQFLPSQWATSGRDGNGDGTADPNQIDDAALAAADYLCAGGRNLSTADGWMKAVTSYNHDAAYVERVRAKADQYAEEANR
jgi:membrane-bound lytic murein transglycosylase B